MKYTIKTLCVAFALTAVASCNKEQDLPSIREGQSSSITQSKEELQLQAQFQKQRDMVSLELAKQRKAYQSFRSLETVPQADYLFDPEARERAIKEQTWAEETKRFYLNLPRIYSGELRCPSIQDISRYEIPDKEKQMLTNSIAFVSAIQSDRFSSARMMGEPSGEGSRNTRAERVQAAVKACDDALNEALANATVTAVIQLGFGALFGGPSGAASTLTSAAASATASVVVAYVVHAICVKQAQATTSQAVAPNYDPNGAVVPPSTVAPPTSTEVPPSAVAPPPSTEVPPSAVAPPPSTSAGDSMSTVAPPPPHLVP